MSAESRVEDAKDALLHGFFMPALVHSLISIAESLIEVKSFLEKNYGR